MHPILTLEKKCKICRRIKGGFTLSSWTTPEEMARKRELKKKLVTVSFFVLAIVIGALVTVASHEM